MAMRFRLGRSQYIRDGDVAPERREGRLLESGRAIQRAQQCMVNFALAVEFERAAQTAQVRHQGFG